MGYVNRTRHLDANVLKYLGSTPPLHSNVCSHKEETTGEKRTMRGEMAGSGSVRGQVCYGDRGHVGV